MTENNHGMEERRIQAEIKKLELESMEISQRIEQSSAWYKGRFLFEAIVGGLVAGALFITWFIGFYNPWIQAESQRIDLVRMEAESALKDHIHYVELIKDAQEELHVWSRSFENRLRTNKEALINSHASERRLQSYISYITKEEENLSNLADILKSHVNQSQSFAENFKDRMTAFTNTDFRILIVYDVEFKELAESIAKALRGQGFDIPPPKDWSDWKEEGDGSMTRFFSKGPVLWYDSGHSHTADKAQRVVTVLQENALPTNMTMHHGEKIQVPGTTWSKPRPYDFQLWLFQSERGT